MEYRGLGMLGHMEVCMIRYIAGDGIANPKV
jgi:hypothetical protein